MRTIFYIHIVLLLIFFQLSQRIYAQNLGCNFKPGDITLVLSGQSQGTNISSQILLIDAGNIIRYKSLINQTTLFKVAIGSYKAVAITFDNQTIPPVEVGKNSNDINNCLKSKAISLNICDCNSSDNFILATIQVAGNNQQYVLTDGRGIILQIQTKPSFRGITNGVYNLYATCTCSDNSQPVAGLVLGGNIQNINGANLCLDTPLSYVVCLPECKLEMCVPFSIVKIRKI